MLLLITFCELPGLSGMMPPLSDPVVEFLQYLHLRVSQAAGPVPLVSDGHHELPFPLREVFTVVADGLDPRRDVFIGRLRHGIIHCSSQGTPRSFTHVTGAATFPSGTTGRPCERLLQLLTPHASVSQTTGHTNRTDSPVVAARAPTPSD